ncbi:MAG: DUF4153 domain-containing protein [Chitinispirillia bacterium]|nr:DUF4153 domain-containing protein [Chitinispirillia bacterium]MCL2269268.1 DUF4153 domain-containing protein [Chitinispirillia bacterium]
MKKSFSISDIAQKPLLAAKRFPVTVFLAVAYAAMLSIDKVQHYTGLFSYQQHSFFLVSMFISTAAALWLEDFVSSWKKHAITAAITLIWGASKFIEQSDTIELTAIGIAAFLALFFLPFLKKGSDNAFWNFAMDTACQLALAFIFSCVLYIGLWGAEEAIETFFGVNTYSVAYIPWVFSFVLAAPLYFLANIPGKAAKRREEVAINKALKVFALYVLVPVAAIYTVILYVYLAQIIITWELPNGLVSYMVSAIAFIGLLTAVLLYPTRTTLPRYFGLILLPLLVLMSAGIIRRFNDYGITVARCYVLLMNLWFYGIYAYLFVTKAKRVKWMLISFSALTLIASVGPWSVTAYTKRALLAEVNRLSLELYNADIPPDERGMFDNSEKAERLRNKVRYLQNMYGKEIADGIIMPELSALYNNALYNNRYVYAYSKLYAQPLHINNFNTLVHFNHSYDNYKDNININYSVKKNLLYIAIPSHDRTFSVPMAQIIDNEEVIYQDSGYAVLIEMLAVKRFEMSDSIALANIKGILLYNHASSDTAASLSDSITIRRPM